MSNRVWLDHDQKGLDAELNLRQRWPHFASVFERWAKDSAKVRAERGGQIDLAYGPTPGQKLDFFHPGGKEPVPLLVFIHGGYWQALDKGDFTYLAPPFLDRGVAFASLNYDLAPNAPIMTMAQQIDRALSWVMDHAKDLAFDPARVLLAGHSAGGHLAILGGSKRLNLTGVISISGVYDLQPIRLSYQQAVLKISDEEVLALSPLRRAPLTTPPTLLAVSGGETNEFLRQHRAYLAHRQALDLPTKELLLGQLDHFATVDQLADPSDPLFAWALSHLGGPGLPTAKTGC